MASRGWFPFGKRPDNIGGIEHQAQPSGEVQLHVTLSFRSVRAVESEQSVESKAAFHVRDDDSQGVKPSGRFHLLLLLLDDVRCWP